MTCKSYSRAVQRALLVLAGAALLGVAATPGPPGEPAGPVPAEFQAPTPTAVATPARAGARPVSLTLALHYEMVCGRPGRGPLVVTLPEAMVVPHSIPHGAVILQGRRATAVAVAGHVVTVAVPKPAGVSCHSITIGTLRTTFTPAAGLGNPRAAGTYTVRARVAGRSFAARLTIHA